MCASSWVLGNTITVVIVLGVVSVLLAVGGGYVLAAMMHAVA